MIIMLVSIDLHYGRKVLKIEIPKRNLLAILQPRKMKAKMNMKELIRKALNKPVGYRDFNSVIGGKRSALIVVDDYTRETPTSKILPPIIEELHSSGLRKEDIAILMALGTHRIPSKHEVYMKLGELVDEYETIFHDWKGEDMVLLGRTKDGVPIRVNKAIEKYEAILGIGMIVPHRVAGYSGGSKIIQPGISGPEITGHTHWLSAGIPVEKILGKVDNDVRREMDYVSKLSKLRAILNVVMDKDMQVINAFFGEPRLVYTRGAELARKIYGSYIPKKADIVVAECPSPKDIDMWQAAKALYSAALAVKEGGTIILLARCPEGISREHPEIEQYGYMAYDEVNELVKSREIDDLIAAAHIAHVGEIIKRKARCYLISEIPRRTAEKVGFTYINNLDEALETSMKYHGEDSKVVIIKDAPNMLPIVRSHE